MSRKPHSIFTATGIPYCKPPSKMQFSPTNDLENWLIYSKRNIKTDKLGIVQKGYFGKETKFVKI